MSTDQTASALCEAQIEEFLKPGGFKSWPNIAKRLLSRRRELTEAYYDISEQCRQDPRLIYCFMDALFCSASAWSESAVKKMRHDEKRMYSVNAEISEVAHQLSDLLAERDDLQNKSSFGTDTYYHIIDVVEAAARGNGSFNLWVKEPLDKIRGQFDMKYWPDLHECIHVISADADRAKIRFSSQVTQAALDSSRSSRSDIVRALFRRTQDSVGSSAVDLPDGFKLKDDTWASLINVAYDLHADSLVDGPYIKRLRQRDRQKKRETTP